jgi:ADP-ribose pyrophosphatase YjhB (NUDIX family)
MRSKYGHPFHLWMTQEFDEKGWFMVQKSAAHDRASDVTLFIQDSQNRFALMSKHSYPPGVFRSPSGGIEPGEAFEAGAKREAREETGLDVALKRFVMHVTLDITHEDDLFRWDSYVFSASTNGERLAFTDRKEVKSATWALDTQMDEMSRKLRETGNGGLMYRARLSDAYMWSLTHPLVLREANEKDRDKIDGSAAVKDPRVENTRDILWWTAEVHGLYAGSVGLRTHANFLELVGLNVHPMFRGRGIGHSLVDYAVDRLSLDSFLKTLSPETRLASQGGYWLLSNTPGYFMPSGFHLPNKDQVPQPLSSYLKVCPTPNLTAMRYHA